MLPPFLSALLTYTVAFPSPSHVNLTPIHSLECLTKPLPITLHKVWAPVRAHGAVVVAAECTMTSDPAHTFALRMLTSRVDESYVFCMTNDGRPIVDMFFKVTPSETGHELTMQARCYRGQSRARLFIEHVAETIMHEIPLWRFDFVQHPELRKYREFVLQDQ